MAAGAVHGNAQERLARVFDDLGQGLVPAEDVPVANQEPGRRQGGGVLRLQLVAREHLLHHAVVALVRVQGLDDPVSPAPDVAVAVADFLAEAVPVAVTPDVHPMPAPSFPVPRAGQEPIDGTRIGIGGAIGQEGADLLPRGGEAGQIQGDSSDERLARGERARTDAVGGVLGPNKGVDGISGRGDAGQPWRRRAAHLFERPPLVPTLPGDEGGD